MVVTKSCVSSGGGCVVVGLKASQDKDADDQGAYRAASLTQLGAPKLQKRPMGATRRNTLHSDSTQISETN